MELGDPTRHPVVRMSLFWRVFTINAIMLVMAAAVLALSPATSSRAFTMAEAVLLAVGVAGVLGVTLALLRRTVAPLERLTRLMRRVDPMRPGERIPVDELIPEVTQLTAAFNEMLDRLERARRDSGRRALIAQEDERRRIARELHDEVGQTITSVVLQLEALARDAPDGLRDRVIELRETARDGVEEVRAIARRLRPEALDDFGLRAALATLSTGFAERAGLTVRRHIATDLPALAREDELAIYRVAQESLTNVARHAGAQVVELELRRGDGELVLSVRDDGCGIAAGVAPGTGLEGMRERALLAGASLRVAPAEAGGTEVRLALPLDGRT